MVVECSGWFTVRELADKLGKHRRTVYGWINDGRIQTKYIQYLPSGIKVICIDGVLSSRSPRKS